MKEISRFTMDVLRTVPEVCAYVIGALVIWGVFALISTLVFATGG